MLIFHDVTPPKKKKKVKLRPGCEMFILGMARYGCSLSLVKEIRSHRIHDPCMVYMYLHLVDLYGKM